MKKEEIYVVIDSEEKRLRAIQILTDETILLDSETAFRIQDDYIYLHFYNDDVQIGWFIDNQYFDKTEITLDQLEQLLNTQFAVKKVVLSIDELQKQAESLGFELVKKERQIKVGDFGKFFDYKGDEPRCCSVGFLTSIDKTVYEYRRDNLTSYKFFRHLTDEEKKQIQENW